MSIGIEVPDRIIWKSGKRMREELRAAIAADLLSPREDTRRKVEELTRDIKAFTAECEQRLEIERQVDYRMAELLKPAPRAETVLPPKRKDYYFAIAAIVVAYFAVTVAAILRAGGFW